MPPNRPARSVCEWVQEHTHTDLVDRQMCSRGEERRSVGLLKQRPTPDWLVCSALNYLCLISGAWLNKFIAAPLLFSFVTPSISLSLCLFIWPPPLAAPHQSGFITILLLLVIKSYFSPFLHLYCLFLSPLFLHHLSFLACAQETSSVYTYERKNTSQIRHKQPMKYSLHLSACGFLFFAA